MSALVLNPPVIDLPINSITPIIPIAYHAPIPVETKRGISESAGRLQPKIAQWLDQHGYKEYQRNAILKLIWRESRFVPGVIAKSGSACLFQWVGPRKAAVFRGTRGCPSWQAQMTFMDWELHNVKDYAAFWRAGPQSAANVLVSKFALGG